MIKEILHPDPDLNLFYYWLLPYVNQAPEKEEFFQELESFWAVRRDTSLNFPNKLVESLRNFNDQDLIAKYQNYDESGDPYITFDDYKELAIDWLNEKKITLEDDKFEVYREDLIFKWNALKVLSSLKSNKNYDPEFIDSKINFYNDRIEGYQNELIQLFNQKIKTKVDSWNELSHDLYMDMIRKLKVELFESIRTDSFDYFPELRDAYVDKLKEIHDWIGIGERRQKLDTDKLLNLPEQLMVIDYMLSNKVLENIKSETAYYTFLARILNVGPDEARIALRKVKSMMREIEGIDTLKVGEIQTKVGNLEKIVKVFEEIKNSEVVDKINKQIILLEKKKEVKNKNRGNP